MTNEQKAKRLEEISACPLCMESGDTPLLRESAALWRERDGDDALWEVEYQRKYKRFELSSWPGSNGKWFWAVTYLDLCYKSGEMDTLGAAKAAAIAWVDQREGE
jgi:hypothetical protein